MKCALVAAKLRDESGELQTELIILSPELALSPKLADLSIPSRRIFVTNRVIILRKPPALPG